MIQHRLPRLQFCICFWQWIKWRQIRYSHIYCVVCLCIITKLKQEKKKVCLYGQLPELSGCQLLNVDAMQSLHQVERMRPFPACLWAVFWGLLTVFYLFSFSQVKMNGCIVDLAFSGEPKAIPWIHVTPLWCSTDAWAHQDIRYGDVFVWPTNLGWMMGPNLIFGGHHSRLQWCSTWA